MKNINNIIKKKNFHMLEINTAHFDMQMPYHEKIERVMGSHGF